MINKEISSFLKSISIFIENASSQKKLNEELVQQGWYPNTITIRHKKFVNESIDDFMIRCLTEHYYEDIKSEYFYNSYPHRRKIYEEAFKLYEEQRYLAAIPLFLSQIDGIISESGLSGMFLGDNKLNNNSKPEKLKFFEYLKFHIHSHSGKSLIKYNENIIELGGELSISKGTSQIQNPDEIEHLNRHGILHGNKKFLDYGTQINTLKVISLTLFIMNAIEKLKIEST
ncbi:hypothetical protein [Acinetobacter sp. CS-2]|jgi:hypothetical protein|uniref:hypothetical protein n=1 Tax=Acinetobacter sp. CS-2 TaxID=2798861 RepID=UPI0019080B23|nr:hypothetical protein [Acinetobacter sp. CS-2]QQN38540.1 hypothetical protein JFY49_10975 [Acinetobacter sp. CS-2]